MNMVTKFIEYHWAEVFGLLALVSRIMLEVLAG